MDIGKILSDLRAERGRIDEAILSLERLARGSAKRRGRPPAWLAEVQPPQPPVAKRRGRPPGSKNKPAAEPETPPASSAFTSTVAA